MTDLIDQLAAALAAHLGPSLPIDIDLWSARESAGYFKVSARHFMERIAPLPDFPNEIRLPSEKGRSHPRWKAREVIEWAESYSRITAKPRKTA